LPGNGVLAAIEGYLHGGVSGAATGLSLPAVGIGAKKLVGALERRASGTRIGIIEEQKRVGSRYWSGRSRQWLKSKNPAFLRE